MTLKRIGRMICAVALAGAAIAVPLTMTGCNTDHPEAKITVEYNNETFVLNYKMYRNMYPQTVQHFIELADNGFYNDTIIHNYSSSYLYGGGYSYLENDEYSYSKAYSSDDKEDFQDYLMDGASKEKEYDDLFKAGKLTPSVYHDVDYTRPYSTLIGEFSNNQHKIDNGALRSSYGCLRMYYSPKSKVKNRVYLDKQGSAKGVQGEYSYNSATSLFSIQTSNSTSSDSSYCIFAVLKNTEVLESLKASITKNSSTTSVKVYIDKYDEYLGANANEATYSLQKTPIIIKSVKITKY